LKSLGNRITLIAGLAVFIWVVELVNAAVGHQLSIYGIMPRDPASLPGILFAPFLHGSIAHAAANTVPLILLGVLVAMQAGPALAEVMLMIAGIGGFGVWLLARPAYHVGASGMVLGFFGYLLANAWYRRSLMSVLVAFVALMLYGGSLWSVLPNVPYLSWEMHLFGLLAGILAAGITSRKG
jgi:membrane associated rhomboid family serine protease